MRRGGGGVEGIDNHIFVRQSSNAPNACFYVFDKNHNGLIDRELDIGAKNYYQQKSKKSIYGNEKLK